MNRLLSWLCLCCTAAALFAAVPELETLVPAATGYNTIASFNPLTWRSKGYDFDVSERISEAPKRVGFLLVLTGESGEKQWAFASMKAFEGATSAADYLVPGAEGRIWQCYVENLEVASNVPGVATGRFVRGNVEIWGTDYSQGNSRKIPGASDGTFDFGDTPGNRQGGYGSFQIHNFEKKQTIISFSNFSAGKSCDLGIGNCPSGNMDWTFSGAGKNWKSAQLLIVGQFDKFELGRERVSANAEKTFLTGTTSPHDPLTYKPGEEMLFKLSTDFGGVDPEKKYYVKWTRTGDDLRTVSGKEEITRQKPVEIITSLDKPGFVRIYAQLLDEKGNQVYRNGRGVYFDGGAAVAPESLRGAPEPADFDEYWARQKARLAAVKMIPEVKKVGEGKDADIYAVQVSCAGLRPVTGYMTIPHGAHEKSLPVHAIFHGYGIHVQRPPADGPKGEIQFVVNAHGYDLGRDNEYYERYFKAIRTDKYSYAFSPEQNNMPDFAYFNGMALRVMRALEYLRSRPEWNGRDVKVTGGSQGGLQTVWAAALDPLVTEAYAGIPWCCDLSGGAKMGRLTAGWRVPYVPGIEYFDAANHGRRIKCKIEITRAGLGDYTCPPSGVAVLFNNIPSQDKCIRWVQGSDHGYVPPENETYIRR